LFFVCFIGEIEGRKKEQSELESREQEGAEDEMIGSSLRNKNTGTEGVLSYSLTRIEFARDKQEKLQV
jgi:hypothetical protein